MPEWLEILGVVVIWLVCAVGVGMFLGRLIAAGKEGPDA